MENTEIITTAQLNRRRFGYGVFMCALVAFGYIAVSSVSLPSVSQGEIRVIEDPVDTRGAASVASALVDDSLPSDPSLPSLSLTAGLVTRLGASHPLFVYRPDARWPLASVTKLMTTLVAYETLTPSAIIPISESAAATEGTAGGMSAGERYSVADCARAMLTVSSNDAALAVAEAYDRKQLGEEAYASAMNKTALFTDRMQQRARDLGMYETYFGDPSGLSVINQSTLGDVAVLVEYLSREHPEILALTAKKEQTILERKSMTRRTLVNINVFAGRSDFLGGKTGYTDEAGGNLVSLFDIAGERYLIIVLGTEDRFGETEKLLRWTTDHLAAIKLP